MSEKQQPEGMDTWPEVVAVLDRYSMEAWRAGGNAERERILQLALAFEPNLLTEGATRRDIEAFEYVTWQFRHQLIEAIKGENK